MARYRDAIQWIANNDRADLGGPEQWGYVSSVVMIAHLWGKDPAAVAYHVKKRRSLDRRAADQLQQGEEDYEAELLDAGVTA